MVMTMNDYLEVKIDVFEHTGQRVQLRRTLSVDTLINEILKEFDDIPTESPEKYAVYLKGVDQPLTRNSTIAQLDIQPQDELVFDYVRQTFRKMLEVHQYAFLREESTGKVYDIQWQPAVIGRPSTDVDHNIMLAVNVQLLPNGMTISRRHAQITLSEGHYFIEPLAEQNPVYLNGKELAPLTRREIKHGDKLLLGRNKIAMTFLAQAMQQSALKEPKSQIPLQKPMPTPFPQPVSEKKDETLFVSEENILSYLVVEKCTVSERIGQRQDIVAYPFVLGRETPILLNEAEISRRHAEFTFDPRTKKFYITDLHSTNGVAINANYIQPDHPHEISQGVHIQLGPSVVVRFEI